MGTSTGYANCGCKQSRLMEPSYDVFIEWVKCAEHYTPEDDAKILEAAKNHREMMRKERLQR